MTAGLAAQISNVCLFLRMANYPVGLGDSRISILVTDDAEQEPVVMTIYTVHMYRESRPSLPMFGEHVMCSFVQVRQLLSYWLRGRCRVSDS